MRAVIAVALIVLTAGCGSSEQAAPSTSTTVSSTATTTTSSTPTRGALADRWDKTFAAVPTPASPPCDQAAAQTMTCASFLTKKVEAVSALGAELRQRADGASRYLDTLMAIEKVMNESERYAKAKCYEGGSTAQNCHEIAQLIGLGSVNVSIALRGDDLAP
jgi:hypothetical protein